MSLDYETYPLKELNEGASVFSGFAFKSKDFSDEGIPIVKIKNIQNKSVDLKEVQYFPLDKVNNKHKKFFLKNNDVLIAMTGQGSLGRVGRINLESNEYVLLNQRVGKFVVDEKNLHLNYLYHVISSDMYEKILFDRGTGSGQPNLSPEIILGTEIPMPNLTTQKKISSILDNINSKINLNKKINKNLDDLLDVLFKEHFINKFDNENNNWKIKKIGELPLIITDYVANGSFASLKENVSILDYENYAYFIRNTDLKAKCFEKFVNKHSYDFLKKSSLYGNEIIISNVGDVGSVFLCPLLDKPMTLGNNMILVKSNDDDIYLNFYLFLLFRSNFGQYLISTITSGSVQSKFNKTEFKSLELIMPGDELIIKFNEFASPIFDYKNKLSDEITNLTKLRDFLLPKLMSGEIDVSKINCDLELKYNYMKYLFNQIHTPMSKSVV